MGEQFKNSLLKKEGSKQNDGENKKSIIPGGGHEVMRTSKVDIVGLDGNSPSEGELRMSIKCDGGNPNGKKEFSQTVQFKPKE